MPSVCEKSIQLLADLQPSCSDQAFKSNQTQKISGVFEKKKLQTVPKIFSHQKHGESIFSMSKKNECFTVSFFQIFCYSRPASPWMPTSTGFVRPIRSPLMSTYSQLDFNVENKQTPVEGEMTLNTGCFRFGDPYSSLI